MIHPIKRSDDAEYDFALIAEGVSDLTELVEDALFTAGCDDATLSIRYGRLYIEFSRAAGSLREAIISAIRDVQTSGLPLRVLRVDDCSLVTASEIARRIGRSRQLVHQYMTGKRGPGGFPAPACHLADHSPLWSWLQVSSWLAHNDFLRPEESLNAEVVDAINTVLERQREPKRHAQLVKELARELLAATAHRE